MMKVFRIVNSYRLANTFVISIPDSNEVIIIDVGGPEIGLLLKYIREDNKRVAAVLLTHEHADHCLGVNDLYMQQVFPIYCSLACSQNIKNSRQNFSFYSDEIPTFEIHHPCNVPQDNEEIEIAGVKLRAITTPGHSPGGMCYFLNDLVFTGDTILNDTKTPLTFPHSNRETYADSILRLSKILMKDMQIYPGHGENFQYQGLSQLETYTKQGFRLT